jgi:gas vesicle protein
MNKTTQLFIALAAGAVAGAVLGILFAPDKGEETREKLVKKGKEFAGDISKKMKDVKDHYREAGEAIN